MVDSVSTLRTATVVFVGSVGMAIAITEAFGGVPSLGTAGSTIALTVLAAPLAYAGYRVILSKPAAPGTRTEEAAKMEAEEVKQRTERWSEEAAINPAFPPGQGPDQQSSSLGQDGPKSSVDNSESIDPKNRDHEWNLHSPSVDPSELEFNWQTETDVSFDDIGGMEDLKAKLRAEVIKPMENREKAKELGVAAPNLIFHGPPGTGKTFTAEALATELGLPFAKLSGADVQSKWINESASTVNNLFSEAKEMAVREGGAVVFLDELDSVLKARSGSGSSHEEDNKVVNEFLNHLESTKEHNIVFVGATNRLEALDDAGIRSGRIDLKIYVGKPDAEAREAILHAQLADREHEISDENIADLAAATDGAVAADLEQLVNRAAKNVLSRGGDTIYRSDFD
jgi:SpoVK/Ycf46/Vps4 family AAA+-type ATPase